MIAWLRIALGCCNFFFPLITSSAAHMPGVIAICSCGVMRATVYYRRLPKWTLGGKSALGIGCHQAQSMPG